MRLAFTTEVVASYIRKLGYPASPQSTVGGREGGGYQVLIPPLLLWAGIGEVSRAGIILNPFLGMGFKAAAVLTDMPLAPDSPIDFGLQSYCKECKICAQSCPSRSIPEGDKVMYNGYETWKLDERSCAGFSLTNTHGTICNTCIKVCPWTRTEGKRKRLFRHAVGYSSLTRKLAVKSGSLLSRSKPNTDRKWWFDMRYVNGVLSKPE
jgi:ferredoxin